MLGGAFAFSGMATLAHALAPRCDWVLVATARAGLAFLLATLVALHTGARLVLLRPRVLWLRSLAGTLSLICTFYALPRLPISDVLTFTNMFPIWIALLSWPLTGVRPTREAWAAIAVGFVGVLLVAQPHIVDSRPIPAIVALAASFSTSLAMLGLHRLREIHPWAIVAHFSGVSFVACLILLVLDPADSLAHANLESTTLLMLGGMGLCATLGQLCLTKAFAAGPPAKVSVVALTQVGFAMFFVVLFWGRAFGYFTLLGILFVMAPTAWLILQQRPKPSVRPDTPPT